MKTTKFISLVIFFFTSFFSSVIYSQNGPINQRYDIVMTPFWDFYSLNYQSVVNAGKGYTGIASSGDIMSTALNPASLQLDKKFQVYGEYTLKPNMPWLTSLGLNDLYLQQNHPSMGFGFGYKVSKDFQFGAVYRSERNYRMHIGTVIVTNDSGETNGQTYEPYETFITHTFSVPAVYEYKFLKFGANLNLVILHSYRFLSTSGNGNAENNYYRFIPDFGLKLTPLKNLSFGITFTPGIKQDITWKFDDALQIDSTISYFPMKIGAGFEFRLLENKLFLSGEYRFEKTSDYQKVYLNDFNYKDRHNIHLGIEYKPDEKISVRTGFFTNFDIRDTTGGVSYLDPIGDYDQYYLTLGAGYKYQNYNFNVAFLNAFSKRTSHMNFNFGVSYDF